MIRFLTMAVLVAAVFGLAAAPAHAQVTVYSGPPVVTYSVPAPATVYYSVPTYTYYAPAPVYRTYSYYAPAPVVSAYPAYATTVVTPRRVRVRYYGPYYYGRYYP
jgi:hypothetical protein